MGEEEVCDFVMPDSVVAVAAPKSSADTVWLIKVVEVNQRLEEKCVDDYGHEIGSNMVHLSGHFLEQSEKRSTTKRSVYKESTKISFFYKESILYPYVNMQEQSNGYLCLNVEDYTDILYYIENNGFSHL